MKKLVLSLVVLSMTLVTACTQVPPKTVSAPPSDETTIIPSIDSTNTPISTQEASQTPSATSPSIVSYTMADVAQHGSALSCWIVIEGGVYDVTAFIPNHPGGDKILRGCGKDATQMFARHPASAKAMKEQYYIGDLKQ